MEDWTEDKVAGGAKIGLQPMKRIFLLVLVAIFQPGFAACAQDHGRIKKKPPTSVEVERIAWDTVVKRR
jgi:hypothetical protein